MGDWNVRGQDLQQYFAGFGRRLMPDRAIWTLSLAASTLPDHHIGCEAWLTCVSGIDTHCVTLQRWVAGLSLHFIRGRGRPARAKHGWHQRAALDGLIAAIFGHTSLRATTTERAQQFEMNPNAYVRMRRLIQGLVELQMSQFEQALIWAAKRNMRNSFDINELQTNFEGERVET